VRHHPLFWGDGSEMTGAPLAGRRVVITRAADQAAELVDVLRALGAEPIVVPLIQIVEPADGGSALDQALDRLGEYEWLVVTSPNGARRVGAALAGRGSVRPRIAAVGAATAAALTASLAGALPGSPTGVDLTSRRQIAEGLVDAFPTGDGTGRVLLAQAEAARPIMAVGLRAKGWQVETVVAYRTLPARPSADDLIQVMAADAVLFASGSAVRSWMLVFGPSTPPVVIAIGPETASIAANFGFKVGAVAADHSVGGMVTSLLSQLSDSD